MPAKNSLLLAEQALFVATRKLLSGDVAMIAKSTARAEILCKHATWRSLLIWHHHPGAIVGSGSIHIPVKSMKLTPETIAEVSAEPFWQKELGSKALRFNPLEEEKGMT